MNDSLNAEQTISVGVMKKSVKMMWKGVDWSYLEQITKLISHIQEFIYEKGK